jgi:hypothetical protein
MDFWKVLYKEHLPLAGVDKYIFKVLAQGQVETQNSLALP